MGVAGALLNPYLSLLFSFLPSFVSSFQTLWHAGIQFDCNGEMDWRSVTRCCQQSVMILPSVARMHSFSVSNIYPHLEGPSQIGHPTQTKRPIEFQIQSFPLLVSFFPVLPISLSIACVASNSFTNCTASHFVHPSFRSWFLSFNFLSWTLGTCRGEGRAIISEDVEQWGGQATINLV